MSILLSVLSIGYCLFGATFFSSVQRVWRKGRRSSQMVCFVQRNAIFSQDNTSGIATYFGRQYFGNTNFVYLLLYLLYALVILAEVREIVSYICSNWTKVALICHYVNHASWQRSPAMRKCVACVLRWRCGMMKHWEDKMNQCSIMAVHPRKNPVALLLRRLVHLPEQNNEIPGAVKAAIIDALRRRLHEPATNPGSGSTQASPRLKSPELQVRGDILWKLNGAKGIADTILVCHVATSLLEARSSRPAHRSLIICDHEIVATHLSQYRAYLVAYCPELLPDDDDNWCKSLYRAVKKDAARVLAAGGSGVAGVVSVSAALPEVEYEELVRRLRAAPNHEVLKNGAEVGKRLVELVGEGDREMAWKVLAGFWMEMILYVAPSDDINGHAEAIARGGELITLLWALLTHLGVVSRTSDDIAVADVARVVV